jgi:hypothetical protein
MNELKKKLKELQKQGYEQVTISQVLEWMSNIKLEAKVKRIERGEKFKVSSR